MAAGIWAVRLGLRPCLFEAGEALGGQLLRVHSPITDYPGIPTTDGPGLARRFAAHCEHAGVSVELACAVTGLRRDPLQLHTATTGSMPVDAVILATGVSRRVLGLASERRLRGRGVSYTVTRDRGTVEGEVAVIVGGGDAAFEGAALLAEVCGEVHLVHRGTVVARPDFRAEVERDPRIDVHAGRSVVEVLGDPDVRGVRLDDGREIPCAGLFVRIGVEPATGTLCGDLTVDERGYLVVDRDNRCAPGIYAVGDLCSPDVMSVSVAVGQAMIACKHIQRSWL